MPPSSNNDISSVQPTIASEGTSVFGQRGDREESLRYQGVQKIKERPIYVGYVWENDHATKSKQPIYLGKFDKDENAARARDLVALKLWGSCVETNFPQSHYKKALEAMTNMTQTEVVATVRRLSLTFSKSISIYHGVSRHVFTGKWQAHFGLGSKSIFLGLFDTEEEAARAFDVESIRLRGHNAITNFDIKFYNVHAILHGETDENVIYHSQDTTLEATIQPFEMLQNIIGTSTLMLYDTGIGNRNGETDMNTTNPRVERPIPINIVVSGNTEEQENVALASILIQQDNCDTNRNEGDREGSSNLRFHHSRSSAFKEFIT